MKSDRSRDDGALENIPTDTVRLILIVSKIRALLQIMKVYIKSSLKIKGALVRYRSKFFLLLLQIAIDNFQI